MTARDLYVVLFTASAIVALALQCWETDPRGALACAVASLGLFAWHGFNTAPEMPR